jgi:hypothetical protein
MELLAIREPRIKEFIDIAIDAEVAMQKISIILYKYWSVRIGRHPLGVYAKYRRELFKKEDLDKFTTVLKALK